MIARLSEPLDNTWYGANNYLTRDTWFLHNILAGILNIPMNLKLGVGGFIQSLLWAIFGWDWQYGSL